MKSDELGKILNKAIIALKNEEDINDKLFEIIHDFVYLFENDASISVKARYYKTIQKKIDDVLKLKKMLKESEDE